MTRTLFQKCSTITNVCILLLIILLLVISLYGCGSKKEEVIEYETQYHTFAEAGIEYEQLETTYIKVTYPIISLNENDKTEVGSSSEKKNTTFTCFNLDNRFVFIKVIDWVDLYGSQSDVQNVSYQLYNCAGFISKGSKSDTPKSINMKRFVLNSKVFNEYHSEIVTLEQNEMQEMQDSNILLPLCICIVGDQDAINYNSEENVDTFVSSELEKAVIKVTIQYYDGSVTEKYLKLETTKNSSTYIIYEINQ